MEGRLAGEMSVAMQSDIVDFPPVTLVEGCVSPDGRRLLLRLIPAESGPIQVSLQVNDVESIVTLLLRMAGKITAHKPREDRVRYQPIPLSGLSAGELADGMGCLGITIGGTELMFQIPCAALSEVAHTLLLVGDRDRPDKPS